MINNNSTHQNTDGASVSAPSLWGRAGGEAAIIELEETDSTNRYLMELAQKAGATDDVTVAFALFQTAGRGMGTNTWESERGKNLLFSILVHPTAVPPRWQYLLSMTAALAVRDAVEAAIKKSGTSVPDNFVTIKWPNDIYCGDRKISGTLIDLNLTSAGIRDLVIGTGVNINQRQFLSDAPNPVSLFQITGCEHPLRGVLDSIMERFMHYYDLLLSDNLGGKDEIVRLYHAHLYRRQGFHAYEDAEGRFEAEIVEVAPDGILTLRRSSGVTTCYEFKQVKFLLLQTERNR